MEKYKGRKKIIDNTSVPLSRRYCSQVSPELEENTSLDIRAPSKGKTGDLVHDDLYRHQKYNIPSERVEARHTGKTAEGDSSNHSNVKEVFKDRPERKEMNAIVHQPLLNPLLKSRSKTVPDLLNCEEYIENNWNEHRTVKNSIDNDVPAHIIRSRKKREEIKQDIKCKGPFRSSVIISNDSSSVAGTLIIDSVNSHKQTLENEIRIDTEGKSDISDEVEYHPSAFGAKLFDFINGGDDENEDDETGDDGSAGGSDGNGGKYPAQVSRPNLSSEHNYSKRYYFLSFSFPHSPIDRYT